MYSQVKKSKGMFNVKKKKILEENVLLRERIKTHQHWCIWNLCPVKSQKNHKFGGQILLRDPSKLSKGQNKHG